MKGTSGVVRHSMSGARNVVSLSRSPPAKASYACRTVSRSSGDIAYSIAQMARRQRRKRQARELEAPGSVLKGPRITVNCECGQTQYLAYGERWTCEKCGRSYDTTRIPQEEYEEIRQISLRFRMLPIAFGLL